MRLTARIAAGDTDGWLAAGARVTTLAGTLTCPLTGWVDSDADSKAYGPPERSVECIDDSINGNV